MNLTFFHWTSLKNSYFLWIQIKVKINLYFDVHFGPDDQVRRVDIWTWVRPYCFIQNLSLHHLWGFRISWTWNSYQMIWWARTFAHYIKIKLIPDFDPSLMITNRSLTPSLMITNRDIISSNVTTTLTIDKTNFWRFKCLLILTVKSSNLTSWTFPVRKYRRCHA